MNDSIFLFLKLEVMETIFAAIRILNKNVFSGKPYCTYLIMINLATTENYQ